MKLPLLFLWTLVMAWAVTPQTSQAAGYALQNEGTGFCLAASGSNVIQWHCNSQASTTSVRGQQIFMVGGCLELLTTTQVGIRGCNSGNYYQRWTYGGGRQISLFTHGATRFLYPNGGAGGVVSLTTTFQDHPTRKWRLLTCDFSPHC